MSRPARAVPHRPPIVDWQEVLHDFKGDIRFWLGGFFGALALIFFLADLYVNVGYLTTLSVFSGKGIAVSGLGGIIGVGVAFWVHFGIHRSWTQMQHVAGKVVGTLFTVGILLLSMWFAMTGAEDLWQMDMASEAQLTAEASGLRDTAENDRSTDVEEAAKARAETALSNATAHRQTAEELQVELAGLPAEEYDPRIAEIQSIIGAVPDGVKYNRTVEAMTAYVTEARASERAADAAYQAALTALTTKRDRITGAAQAELKAVTLESGQSYLRTMRAWAQDNLELTWVQYPTTEEEVSANAAIQSEAEKYAKNSGRAIALVVTLGSLLFGLLRFRIKDEPYVGSAHRGPVLDALPSPSPINRGGARFVDEEHIADDAPFQPGREPSTLAMKRLARARELYEQAAALPEETASEVDDLAHREAAAMEKIARAKGRSRRLAEIERLEAEAAKADEPQMRSAPRRSPGPPLEPEVAHRTFEGRSLHDLEAMIDEHFARARILDAELKTVPPATHRWRVIEAELHSIHAEIEHLNGLVQSRQRAGA